MKKYIVIFMLLAFSVLNAIAQSPLKMSYQAVVRDGDEKLVSEKKIGVKISILKDGANGTLQFTETHAPITNINGLMTLEIGNGDPIQGNLSVINWAEGSYFLKTEIDIAGGTNYSISSTSQILSVPYALFANKAETLNDGNQKGQMMYWDGANWVMLNPVGDGLKLVMCNGVPTWGGCTDSSYVQVFTSDAKNISQKIAECEGSLKNDKELPIIEKGICYGIYPNEPTIYGDTVRSIKNSTSFACFLKNLSPSTTYYYRAYVITSKGVDYGDIRTFITLPNETVTDIDGNVYKTVKIGEQTWLAENLRTTKLNNGTSITKVVNKNDWCNTSNPAYCYYNNDMASYKNDYGAIYNQYAVKTNKLCPTGWKVPSEDDYLTLKNYLSTNVGGKLKDTGVDYWESPNTGATNSIGFTALPGGYRDEYSYKSIDFASLGRQGYWWTSDSGTIVIISYNDENLKSDDYNGGSMGASIRCIKNE